MLRIWIKIQTFLPIIVSMHTLFWYVVALISFLFVGVVESRSRQFKKIQNQSGPIKSIVSKNTRLISSHNN